MTPQTADLFGTPVRSFELDAEGFLIAYANKCKGQSFSAEDVTTAAKALGITYQAVRKWPENLTPDIENRLIGMLVRGRRKVPDWLIATKPTKEAA